MKVVLAEDSAPTRRQMEAVLLADGHEVTAVADGGAAWKSFQATQPELVILDWQMPVLDGVELCRRIRQSERAETFVLMVTARDSGDDLATALDAGVDDYLVKPVVPAQLRARLVIAARRIEMLAARRRAEYALARSRWLAGIGETALAVQHEINNPLAALLGHVALAKPLPRSPELDEHLAVIAQQAHAIAAVVHHLAVIQEPRSVEYVEGVRMLDLSDANGVS